MQETQERRVLSLGQEDPLKKEMATCSSILVWTEPGRLQSVRSQELDMTLRLNNNSKNLIEVLHVVLQ